MAIEMVRIRATITFAGISVSTPYIKSFNVRKQRGQISTFEASMKIDAQTFADAPATGSSVTIDAGSYGNEKRIFTGICKSAKIDPCFDDPYYINLTISGQDVLSMVQGKQFTRRCIKNQAVWASIEGVTRRGLRSGKFNYDIRGMTLGADSTTSSQATTGTTAASPDNPFSGSTKRPVDTQTVTLNAKIEYPETGGNN